MTSIILSHDENRMIEILTEIRNTIDTHGFSATLHLTVHIEPLDRALTIRLATIDATRAFIDRIKFKGVIDNDGFMYFERR